MIVIGRTSEADTTGGSACTRPSIVVIVVIEGRVRLLLLGSSLLWLGPSRVGRVEELLDVTQAYTQDRRGEEWAMKEGPRSDWLSDWGL